MKKFMIIFLMICLLMIPFMSLSDNVNTDEVIVINQIIDNNEMSNLFIDVSVNDERKSKDVATINLNENLYIRNCLLLANSIKTGQEKTGVRAEYLFRYS